LELAATGYDLLTAASAVVLVVASYTPLQYTTVCRKMRMVADDPTRGGLRHLRQLSRTCHPGRRHRTGRQQGPVQPVLILSEFTLLSVVRGGHPQRHRLNARRDAGWPRNRGGLRRCLAAADPPAPCPRWSSTGSGADRQRVHAGVAVSIREQNARAGLCIVDGGASSKLRFTPMAVRMIFMRTRIVPAGE